MPVASVGLSLPSGVTADEVRYVTQEAIPALKQDTSNYSGYGFPAIPGAQIIFPKGPLTAILSSKESPDGKVVCMPTSAGSERMRLMCQVEIRLGANNVQSWINCSQLQRAVRPTSVNDALIAPDQLRMELRCYPNQVTALEAVLGKTFTVQNADKWSTDHQIKFDSGQPVRDTSGNYVEGRVVKVPTVK